MNTKIQKNCNWNSNFNRNSWFWKRKSRKLRSFYLPIIHRLPLMLGILLSIPIILLVLPFWLAYLLLKAAWENIFLLRVIILSVWVVLVLVLATVLAVTQTLFVHLRERLKTILHIKTFGKQEMSDYFPKSICQGIERGGHLRLKELWRR